MCADWKIDHDPHEFGMQLGVNYKLHELTIALKDAVDIIQADANTEENYASLCRMGNALSKNSSTAWLLRQKADAVRETAKGIIRLSDECGSYKSDTAATLRVAAGYAERKAISLDSALSHTSGERKMLCGHHNVAPCVQCDQKLAAKSAIPKGWKITRESESRITIEAAGIGFYVARLNSDRASEIMLYALANELLETTS
jgi:hypothetical protein